MLVSVRSLEMFEVVSEDDGQRYVPIAILIGMRRRVRWPVIVSRQRLRSQLKQVVICVPPS